MENIRPLRNEDDYDWALAEIARYFDDQPVVGSAEGDRFEVLATLIEAYEDRHYPISAPDPVSAIRAHMEMAGLKQSALAGVLGSAPRASEILSRRRALTMDMVVKLHDAWHIPADVLIRPYHLTGEEKARGAVAETRTRPRKSA